MAKNILIVDDEREFQEIYTIMLENLGFNFTYAYDGDEAMQMINEYVPDLIIMDMIMDMVTGDTLFLHLKGFQEFSEIPIIIISSMPEKQYKNLKKIDPTLAYLNKANLTKQRLIEELDKELGVVLKKE